MDKISQDLVAVGILVLCEREKVVETETNTHYLTYSIRDESSSLYASRLDSLEEVDHTLCLESLQLRVEADEGPSPAHSITG